MNESIASRKRLKKEWADRFIDLRHAEFEITGNRALFSDPLLSSGGECTTYSVPTYEAMKNICKNIYWKPTFIWIVDKIRVMNDIRTERAGVCLKKQTEHGFDIANFTYLDKVRYKVQAHIEWNYKRPEYADDRDYNKHYSIMARSLISGGRLPVFLGKSDCVADLIAPTKFDEDAGAYDTLDAINFGYMYHGITYADENQKEGYNMQTLDFAPVVMKNGVIEFARPDECIHKNIGPGQITHFITKEERETENVI